MKVIHADHERRYDVPGASEPARRPVEIDATLTGFRCLRSLRLYRFQPGVPVDGHAEEDEVFVFSTSGTAQMKIAQTEIEIDSVSTFMVSAADGVSTQACAAYLPPQSVYQLNPQTPVDVAYARATPNETREPKIFSPLPAAESAFVTTLLEDCTHAQHLRLRAIHIAASEQTVELDLRHRIGMDSEVLVHVQSASTDAVGTLTSALREHIPIRSWDTIALAPGEQAVLHVTPGTALTILTVAAA